MNVNETYTGAKEKTKLATYAYSKMLDDSQTDGPFTDELFLNEFPNQFDHYEVAPKGSIMQREQGIDYILYNKENMAFMTIDKKERFTWRGTGDKEVIFTDIAAEVLFATPADGTSCRYYDLSDFLKKATTMLIENLRTMDMAEAMSAVIEFGKNHKFNVKPGWATADPLIKTVKETWYAIAPMGYGYRIKNEELYKVLSNNLYKWKATKDKCF